MLAVDWGGFLVVFKFFFLLLMSNFPLNCVSWKVFCLCLERAGGLCSVGTEMPSQSRVLLSWMVPQALDRQMVTALGKALWPEALQTLCQYIENSNKYLNRLHWNIGITLEYLLIESEAGKVHFLVGGVVKILIPAVLPGVCI